MTEAHSAHRSSESAHRSGPGELETEVFFVKTPEDLDAVIVSYVDGGDVTGIYLYEPGADPVELNSVGLNGVATEFDYASVEGVTLDGEEVEWPGDQMLTRAQRDADVENAVQDHANLDQAYGMLREQAQALVDATERVHDLSHPGAFQFCEAISCQAAQAVTL